MMSIIMNTYSGNVASVPSLEEAPFQWILGPEDWVYVGKTGGQFVHYDGDPVQFLAYNKRLDKMMSVETGHFTAHIGADEQGHVVSETWVREYQPFHKHLGAIRGRALPQEVLLQALDQTLQDIRTLFAPAQRLVRGLVALMPDLGEVALDFPAPLTGENYFGDPSPRLLNPARVQRALGYISGLRERLGLNSDIKAAQAQQRMPGKTITYSDTIPSQLLKRPESESADVTTETVADAA